MPDCLAALSGHFLCQRNGQWPCERRGPDGRERMQWRAGVVRCGMGWYRVVVVLYARGE